MEKRLRAEWLASYLRWIGIIPGLAVTNCAPIVHLVAILSIVTVYNGILCYFLANPAKFSNGIRWMALVCRIMDGFVITYAVASAGSNNSSAFLLYWLVLVSLGYSCTKINVLALATGATLISNATATFYAAHSAGVEVPIDQIGIRSVIISFGFLVSVYVAKSRSLDDQAVERGSHLQAILGCDGRLANFNNIHEMALYVLELTVRETGASGGEVLLVNDETHKLDREAFYTVESSGHAEPPSEDQRHAYAKWVMSSARELMVDPCNQTESETTGKRVDRHALAAPLLGRSSSTDTSEGVLGVLIVWAHRGERLSSDAMDVLRIFSTITGAAILNLRLYTNMQKSFLNTLQSLAKGLEARDEYTRGHSDRVTQIACAIAEELDTPPERIDLLRNAALLHDIGKIGVPDAVLGKAGKLTAEEWEVMRRHSTTSGEICKPLGLPEEVLFLITHHHERLDGKGYPAGLTAQELPFLQRILVVSDTFDAMRSRRPYRDAMPEAELVAEFNKCAGRTLDPTVVEALKRLLYRRELDPFYAEHDRMTNGVTDYMQNDEPMAA